MQHALDIVALLLVLVAAFGYLNYRFLRLPSTIGLVVIALAASFGVVLFDAVIPGLHIGDTLRATLEEIDFRDALLEGMLSFLLFAGAMHVDMGSLAKRGLVVASLATIGVVISVALSAGGLWGLTLLLGIELPFLLCLVFGALIAPTDPVAVLGILKTLTVPKSLETKFAGESLFNDGVGVVVFSIMVALAVGGEGALDAGHIAVLLAREALGGIALGLLTGTVAFYFMRAIDEYVLEIIISLALVTGTYSLAHIVHTSGPVSVVVAGLLIGNQGTRQAMSETTREQLHGFWKLIDEILNALLFLLIGLEVVAVSFQPQYLTLGALVIPVVLFARFFSVGIPLTVLGLGREFVPGTVPALTWGGLRGGISVALALSLPAWPERDLILTITYAVVVFSIIVQGLTVGAVVKRFVKPAEAELDLE